MFPLNTQPAERVVLSDDKLLEVVNVWDTIQGEGPFAGQPAVFIRLAGCNLACHFCDTNYTAGRKWMEVVEIVEKVQFAPQFSKPGLVVLTGGEPFRQRIEGLVETLHVQGFTVQVETNGTVYRAGDYLNNLSVVCSPKTPKISADLIPFIDNFKYVVEAGFIDDSDGLPSVTLGSLRPARPPQHFDRSDIFIQPLDSGDPDKNAMNMVAAVASARKFGYRLSLQLHKFLGLE